MLQFTFSCKPRIALIDQVWENVKEDIHRGIPEKLIYNVCSLLFCNVMDVILYLL